MAFRTLIYLYCDGGNDCPLHGEQAYYGETHRTETEIWAIAKSHGWKTVDGKHLCPECAKPMPSNA